jgi:hypothetical protein
MNYCLILNLQGCKLAEREVTYKQTHKRMKNMYHQVDIILRAEPGKINAVSVGNITKEYVNIYELLEYPIPYFVIRQFNKELETEAVAKRNKEAHAKQATQAMKAKQATREKQAMQATQAMQMNQEEQSLQVDYNDVLFNGELTFANNFMNQGTFQTV